MARSTRAGHGKAGLAEQALGDVLVHARGGAQDAGADIRQAGQLEQPLHRAVLPAGAVQDGEHNVHGNAVRHVPSQRQELPRMAVGRQHDGGAAGFQRDGGRVVGMEQEFAGIADAPDAVLVDADHDDGKPVFVDGLEDVARRLQRHFVLRRPTATENCNRSFVRHPRPPCTFPAQSAG